MLMYILCNELDPSCTLPVYGWAIYVPHTLNRYSVKFGSSAVPLIQ